MAESKKTKISSSKLSFAGNQSKKENVPWVTVLPKRWAFAGTFIMVRGACMNTDSLCVSAGVR